MKLGSDFWLIAKVVTAIIEAIAKVFGDEEDDEEKKKIVR